ncbi:hypothetical protein [Prolixibacter bellariivorans]|uniref:hypothetical protein n=1 Tax=Prolixibacter bellariivorans TaxID=314319 RepID=UPI00131EDEC7|nr:hypothetical protein [Prolixibacter bellariivorans]
MIQDNKKLPVKFDVEATMLIGKEINWVSSMPWLGIYRNTPVFPEVQHLVDVLREKRI